MPHYPDDFIRMIEDAFEFRGHSQVTLHSGDRLIGFVYNRRRPEEADEPFIEMFMKDTDDRRRISYKDIQSVEPAGKDYAESYEDFLKRTGGQPQS